MGLLDDAYKRVAQKRFLVQGDVLFSNMLGILKENTGDVNGSVGLDIFLAVPFTFDDRKSGAGVTVVFESAAYAPNINRLLDDNASRKGNDPYAPVPLRPQMEEYLDRILTVYNVSDKMLFVSMVADTLDTDLEERSPGSEIALEHPDFMQGHLYGMRHFERLIDAYERLTFDPNLRRIPWKNLIGFENSEVDFNHISPEVLQVLLPDMEPGQLLPFTTERIEVYESMDDLPFDRQTKEKLKKLNVVFYSPMVSGDLLIKRGEGQLHVTFLYNLSSKEVSHIEVAN